MSRYLIIVFVSLFRLSAHSQNVKEDFVKINEAYLNAPQLSFDTRFALYDKIADGNPIIQEMGVVRIQNHIRYCKMGGIETIQTDSFQLVVNHQEKKMSIMPIKKEKNFAATSSLSAMDKEFMDMMLKSSSSVVFKKVDGNTNSYILQLDGEYFNQFKVFYNKKTFLLEKLVFLNTTTQTNEEAERIPARMEIDIYPKKVEQNTNHFIDISTYIVKKKSKFYASDKYKNYTITDLFSKNYIKVK